MGLFFIFNGFTRFELKGIESLFFSFLARIHYGGQWQQIPVAFNIFFASSMFPVSGISGYRPDSPVWNNYYLLRWCKTFSFLLNDRCTTVSCQLLVNEVFWKYNTYILCTAWYISKSLKIWKHIMLKLFKHWIRGVIILWRGHWKLGVWESSSQYVFSLMHME